MIIATMEWLTVADQMTWFIYGFTFFSIPCAVALMIRLFRGAGKQGDI